MQFLIYYLMLLKLPLKIEEDKNNYNKKKICTFQNF